MSRVQPTFQSLGAVDYVALRPVTISGVILNRGDLLPADSPIRTQPRRLEALCSSRRLRPVPPESVAPVMAPVSAKAAPVEAPAPVEVSKEPSDDLDQLNLVELRARCKKLKINAFGGYDQLRARIRAKLG